MKFQNPKPITAGVFLLCSIHANAQIQMEAMPYQSPKPDIQFSIGEAKPVAPVSLAPAPPPVATLTLLKGKALATQFSAYAEQTGWTLIWKASDYVLDHDTTIQGDFEAALTSFLTSANASGSRLRAAFYRGNKTVRVEEF